MLPYYFHVQLALLQFQVYSTTFMDAPIERLWIVRCQMCLTIVDQSAADLHTNNNSNEQTNEQTNTKN